MQKDLPYATINIASGSSVNLLVIIEEILRLTGNEGATVEFDISKPAMIPKRLVDVRLMSSLLNWAPTVSLAEGLATTIQWFQSQEGISS
jgi:nucleoside-diphosphate-sugar epimerase